MLINYAVGYGIASNPVNFELAAPAIEKILLTSPNTFRAFFLSRLSESTHSEPAVQHAIQRFAEHAMDVSDQARKLIPHLFDADEDARKRAREELEKLGPDAAPACEEALKQYQEPFKKLLDSYKASNTDY
jgi:ADP-heptose:LPS heptosyltransferase